MMLLLIVTCLINACAARWVSNVKVTEDQILEDAKKTITFQGCFGGSHNFTDKFPQSNNINYRCTLQCREQGYIIAATRGEFCGCTNTIPSERLARAEEPESAGPGSRCNLKCPGARTGSACHGDECCGGKDAYTVYVIGQIDVLKQVMRRVAANLEDENRVMLREHFGDTPYRYIKHSSGKCIVPASGGGNPLDNTRLVLSSSCDEPKNWFRMLSDGSIQHVTGGKCVHPCGGSPNPSDGTELCVHPGCVQSRVQFETTYNAMIRHKSSQKCWAPKDGKTDDGTLIVLKTVCNQKNDKTHFKSIKSRELNSVRHKNSGKCWDPKGGSPHPGEETPVVIHSGCGMSKNWFELRPDGAIMHVPSGKCIHPFGGSSNPADGTSAVIASGCDGTRLQFKTLSNGAIKHVTSGKCLHPYSGSSNPPDNDLVVFHGGCEPASKLGFEFNQLGLPGTPPFIIHTSADVVDKGAWERQECVYDSDNTGELTCSSSSKDPTLVMEVKTIERELQYAFGRNKKPLGKRDLQLSPAYTTKETTLTKTFTVEESTTNSYSTECGVSIGVTVGQEVSFDLGAASSAYSVEMSQEGFFSSGFSKEESKSVTEEVTVNVAVPPEHLASINMYEETYPLEVKWRATLFAKGQIYVTCAGLTKQFDTTEVLSFEQRKLYAFGTVDYGDRQKVVVEVQLRDKNGNIVQTRKAEEKEVEVKPNKKIKQYYVK